MQIICWETSHSAWAPFRPGGSPIALGLISVGLKAEKSEAADSGQVSVGTRVPSSRDPLSTPSSDCGLGCPDRESLSLCQWLLLSAQTWGIMVRPSSVPARRAACRAARPTVLLLLFPPKSRSPFQVRVLRISRGSLEVCSSQKCSPFP